MKWKQIFNVPLEMPCVPKKEIPLAVPLVMAGASALSSFWGGQKSAEAAEEANRQLQAEKNRVNAERTRAKYEDYIDTAAGQNLMRIARQERDKMWKREAGAAAVAGGTDAAVAQAKEAGNQMIGDTIANVAAQDTARKDAKDASYRQELSNINQQQINAQRAKSQAIADAAGGAASALMQGAVATFGDTKLGQSWFGNGTQQPTGTAPKAPDVGAAPSMPDKPATPVKPITSTPSVNRMVDYMKDYQTVMGNVRKNVSWLNYN